MSNYELSILNALFELSEADDRLLTNKQYNILNSLMDKAEKLNIIW